MSELSPQAQAVLDAYMNNCGWLDGPLDRDYRCAAAVLRAAADQVVPGENVDEADYDCLHTKWAAQGKQETREAFLAIATELDRTWPSKREKHGCINPG